MGSVTKKTLVYIFSRDRISLHRDILEQSKEKVCKQFIEKGLSKFVFG